MRISEILNLVRLNLIQNKFKVLLTSIGIVVGAATIVCVIAIGRGGKADVAEQFRNLNAGALDISYEQAQTSSGFPFGGGSSGGSSKGGSGERPSFSGGNMPDFSQMSAMPSFSGNGSSGKDGKPSGDRSGGFSFPGFGSMFGGSSDTKNSEKITLSTEDMDDITTNVPGLSDATISYTTKQDIYGGNIEETESYTVAGTLSNYAEMSNLTMMFGDYISDSDNENKNKVCVLGYSAAKKIFGSAEDAYDSLVYIDDRPYTVGGVLAEQGTVEAGISADDAIFIPYSTGIKYLTGSDISPTITVIAEDVDNIDAVTENVKTALAVAHPEADFTISDAGSKMEAANKSNRTLTLMLTAMASIVFIIGGIGIMNVLFVSVKERTEEIGILKALGGSRRDILLEFMMEACCMSLIGGVIGVLVSIAVSPVISNFGLRLEMSASGALIALAFSLVTGTVFGFYPAWKASKLVPVEALSAE
ncbi:ABC transporter permease [Ruminococcus albus]|uniref:Putative ABC transport system permease protein n=1 Tax=Ruminococcus albus TaxID=1264 RepID=A0A1I1MW45_RUMAL|nr:ABC transporter permease [Ruminococcus albus]SFC89122.1 putative ABC transport system permease protein [Ruminococcus albus]